MVLIALSAKQRGTKFIKVRFGNILGSRGSVIPLFKQQIKTGGAVKITDKNIIRYFMNTWSNWASASDSICTGGNVLVLDMGKPVRIKDLADKMIA